MANIDDELQTILKAERGDEVRSAIAAAIEKIAGDREYKPQTLHVGDNENHRTLKGGPWDKVIVDVTGEGGATIDLDWFKEVKENGYYTLENQNWPANHGWNGFTVSVPQHTANLGVKEIQENGVYDPLADGFDGYSKVVVSVPNAAGSGDLLTVSFYNGNTLLETTQVAYGGQAIYSGATPVSDTPFVGWNPDPSRVLSNMRCQAVFAGAMGGTISDDWITIAQNCIAGLAQQKYPLGSTKALTFYVNGNVNLPYTMEMVLASYNNQYFKSVNKKVPKTFWYARYMLPFKPYGPLYSLDRNIAFIKLAPAGTENPAALGWYEKFRIHSSYSDLRLTQDTTVDNSKEYWMYGVPTVTLADSQLQTMLSGVDRYMSPIKGSMNGTELVRTTTREPLTPVDSKIFSLTATEFTQLETLFRGLAKQTVNGYNVSLYEPVLFDQQTRTPSWNPSDGINEYTTEINPALDGQRWVKVDNQAVEYGKNYGIYMKNGGSSDRVMTTNNGGRYNSAFRFGFCI